jgi:hypothetical protein
MTGRNIPTKAIHPPKIPKVPAYPRDSIQVVTPKVNPKPMTFRRLDTTTRTALDSFSVSANVSV